jgi:hypothetical protein
MLPILSAGTGTDIDNVNALKLKYTGHNGFFLRQQLNGTDT